MMSVLNTFIVLFAFVSVARFAEANLRLWKNLVFPLDDVIDYLFPKNPIVTRVRDPRDLGGENDGVILDFIGLVQRHGYPAEEHYVTTEDGYNLVIHRIPGSPQWKGKRTKRIAFIQHGILSSSDTWVLFGPGRDLPFLLADEGYDVWLGNTRGNTYCRSHVKITPQNTTFWEFSQHEVGTKDLPAMIDYALNHTGQKTLHYIGHSMGTTTLFILLSTRPEYNAKIKLGVCLAPVAFWNDIAPILRPIINNALLIKRFFDIYGINDLASLTSTGIRARRALCKDGIITQIICVTAIFTLSGSDPAQLNTTALSEMFSYYPAGTSVQTLLHFYQNVVAKDFQSYNYGLVGNYERYKQATPIRYNVGKITAPIALFYGVNDVIAIKTNVLALRKRLPNVVLLEENPYKLMSHLDFMWSIDAKALIYDRVMEVMQMFRIK